MPTLNLSKQAQIDRRLSQRSLYYLCKEVLGYKDLVPHVHGDLTHFATHPRYGRFRQATLPRSWFKTWVWTVGKSIWLTLPDEEGLYQEIYPYKGPNARILIASNVIDNAAKMIYKIKQEWMNNTRLKYAFPELVPEFNKTRWSDHVAEVKRTISATEGTYTAVGVGGSVISQHFDHLIEDDLIYARKDDFTGQELMPSQEDIENAIGWHKLSYSLLANPMTGCIDNVGCLIRDSQILMSNNTWKSIQNITVGESVKSVQGNRLVDKCVTAVIPQRSAPVYTLRTTTTTLTATGTHPILTLHKGRLKFIRLDALIKGDLIVASRKCPTTKASGFSTDACWFLGLMFGDGWINIKPRRYAIFLATGINEEQNNKARRIAKDVFGINFYPTKYGYDRADSIVAKRLCDLGLTAGAKIKRLPKWIFMDCLKNRQAFIKGFIDADGTEAGLGRYSIELSNEALIKDLRLLSLISDYRVTNVYKRTRMIKPPHSPKSIVSKTYHTAISIKTVTRQGANNRHWKQCQRYLDSSLCFDTVKIVKPSGEAEVWDLTVEETHNFITEGICTHNTRWAPQDLVHYLRKHEKQYSCFEITATKKGKWPISSNEDCVWPERYGKETLENISASQGVRIFETQYLNRPRATSDIVFRKEYVNIHDSLSEYPKGLELKTIVDLAGWGDSKGVARNVVLTGGKDQRNHLWVYRLDLGRLNPSEVIEIFAAHSKQFNSKVMIEEIQYQRAVRHFAKLRMEATGEWFNIQQLPFDGRKDAKNLRIRGLEPLISNGGLHITASMKALLEELEYYPYSKTVDILDCLGYLFRVAKAIGVQAPTQTENPFLMANIEKELKKKGTSSTAYPFKSQLEERAPCPTKI